MISEIYAYGWNSTSAFLIVEDGKVVHHGSNKWQSAITFEGVTAAATDLNCEVIAVICALMMCHSNNRKAVNIYADSPETQARYYRMSCSSDFMESFKRHSAGMDIYADRWQTRFWAKDRWTDNPFVALLKTI